jgi:hypothetical protein
MEMLLNLPRTRRVESGFYDGDGPWAMQQKSRLPWQKKWTGSCARMGLEPPDFILSRPWATARTNGAKSGKRNFPLIRESLDGINASDPRHT